MKTQLQANAITCSDVVAYQLLCGRDIANPADASPHQRPIFSSAQGMANYVYLVVNSLDGTALAVDAAWDVDGLYRVADALGAKLAGAIYTHSHFDHCGGKLDRSLTGGQELTLPGAHSVVAKGGRVWVGREEAAKVQRQCDIPAASMVVVADGETIAVGDLALHVLHTPGHTAGSVCLFVDPAVGARCGGSGGVARPLAGRPVTATAGFLITGDTLFVGSCGRTDLPGSDESLMFRSLSRLSTLEPDVCVLPGHNYGSEPVSTIGREKRTNAMITWGLKSCPLPPPLPACCVAAARAASPGRLHVGGHVRVIGGADSTLRGQVGVVHSHSDTDDTYEVHFPHTTRMMKPSDLANAPSAL